MPYRPDMIRKLMHLALNEERKAHDPRLVAAAVERALTARRPRPAYSLKPDPGRRVVSWLSDQLVDRILQRELRR